jgi:hypothetical protein
MNRNCGIKYKPELRHFDQGGIKQKTIIRSLAGISFNKLSKGLEPSTPAKVTTGSIIVLITGKYISGSQLLDTFIVLSIRVNDNTQIQKEIISMVRRDSGVT